MIIKNLKAIPEKRYLLLIREKKQCFENWEGLYSKYQIRENSAQQKLIVKQHSINNIYERALRPI